MHTYNPFDQEPSELVGINMGNKSSVACAGKPACDCGEVLRDCSRDSVVFFEFLALDIDLMNLLEMTDYVRSVGICPIRDLHQLIVLAVLTLPMLI
jgi:hypothetical protein